MADRSNRGFASMDEKKQREIASKGGRAAHQQGTAHEFTPEEARSAGRKGGEAISRNREHMARIGRLGGEASRNSPNRRNKKEDAVSTEPTITTMGTENGGMNEIGNITATPAGDTERL
ncbi:MAG: KGG domain-containing protein [Candidatus Kapaibacterium sp.]